MAASKYVALAAVLAFFSISTSAQAQNDSTPAPEASTFYLEKTETQFSINIAHDSSDVYLYFASPAYSWVGFGFGQQMEDSLMLIMYPDADGNSKLVRTTSFVQNADIYRRNNLPTRRPERRRASLHKKCRDRGPRRHKDRKRHDDSACPLFRLPSLAQWIPRCDFHRSAYDLRFWKCIRIAILLTIGRFEATCAIRTLHHGHDSGDRSRRSSIEKQCQ